MQHLHEELRHDALARSEEVRQERSRSAAFLQMQEQAKASAQNDAVRQHEARQQQLSRATMEHFFSACLHKYSGKQIESGSAVGAVGAKEAASPHIIDPLIAERAPRL